MTEIINSESWLDNIRDKDYYDSYVEECRDNGIEPRDMDSHEFLQWAVEDSQNMVEDDLGNLRCSPALKGVWCITGTLGLWDGRHEVSPVFCESVTDAITLCRRTADDHHLTVSHDEGLIRVDVTHHDGTNSFDLRLLSESAEAEWRDDADRFLGRVRLMDSLSWPTPEPLYRRLPEYLF